MTLLSLVHDIRDRIETSFIAIPKTKKMLKALNSIETAQDKKTITRNAGKIMVAANDAGRLHADECRNVRVGRSDFFYYGNLVIIEFLAEKILDDEYN